MYEHTVAIVGPTFLPTHFALKSLELHLSSLMLWAQSKAELLWLSLTPGQIGGRSRPCQISAGPLTGLKNVNEMNLQPVLE